jgi:hypothetical protein
VQSALVLERDTRPIPTKSPTPTGDDLYNPSTTTPDGRGLVSDNELPENTSHGPRGETVDDPLERGGLPLGLRIVRTLMLLASAIVLVFALPIIAWQATTLAHERVEVDGTVFEFAVTKRWGVVVHVTDPAGHVARHEIIDERGREPDGTTSIAVEDDGRTVRVTVGDQETWFEFANGSFAPVAAPVADRSGRG